jgi:FkbM family methyltransferase
MPRVQLSDFEMDLVGDNYLEQAIVQTGVWEPTTTQFIKEVLQPGMTVVDVGANIGYFSLLMAHLVGSEGQVHAFEPYPDYAEIARHNMALNACSHIYLNEFALSNKVEGHVLLKGVASARMHRWHHQDPVFNKVHDEVMVSCIPFDFYANTRLSRLDLMKIDVDGYEMNVLQGAAINIKRHYPILVVEFCEENFHAAGTGTQEILNLLSDWGYCSYSDQGERFQNQAIIDFVTENYNTSVNIVFLPHKKKLNKISLNTTPPKLDERHFATGLKASFGHTKTPSNFETVPPAVTNLSNFYQFLLTLTREEKARRVLTLGGEVIDTIRFLLSALPQNDGHLTSVGLTYRPDANHLIKNLNKDVRWHFIEAPSDQAVTRAKNFAPFDILLIDGLHSYNQCRRDYFNYAPLVKPGGYILFHNSSAIQGVIDFTTELSVRGLGGVNLPYRNGLFVFRRAEDLLW